MSDSHFPKPVLVSGLAGGQWQESRKANPHGLEELSLFSQNGGTFRNGGRDRRAILGIVVSPLPPRLLTASRMLNTSARLLWICNPWIPERKQKQLNGGYPRPWTLRGLTEGRFPNSPIKINPVCLLLAPQTSAAPANTQHGCQK